MAVSLLGPHVVKFAPFNSSAVDQCNIAPPVNQEPGIEYSLLGPRVQPCQPAWLSRQHNRRDWGLKNACAIFIYRVMFVMLVAPIIFRNSPTRKATLTCAKRQLGFLIALYSLNAQGKGISKQIEKIIQESRQP